MTRHALTSLAIYCLVTVAAQGQETFSALFSGPAATASGTASLTLNEAQTKLMYSITIDGLDLGSQTPSIDDNVLGLHFHNAPAGSNGPIAFGLIGSGALGGALNPALTDDVDDLVIDPTAGTIAGVWETTDSPALTSSMLDALRSQELYLNVHTEAFRGGAIRGQIVPEPASAVLLIGAAVSLAIAGRNRRSSACCR